jgi:hypothetical protein
VEEHFKEYSRVPKNHSQSFWTCTTITGLQKFQKSTPNIYPHPKCTSCRTNFLHTSSRSESQQLQNQVCATFSSLRHPHVPLSSIVPSAMSPAPRLQLGHPVHMRVLVRCYAHTQRPVLPISTCLQFCLCRHIPT